MNYDVLVVLMREINYICYILMKKIRYLPFFLIGVSSFNINFQYFYLGQKYSDLVTLVVGNDNNMQGAINGYIFILVYLIVFIMILDYVLLLMATPFYRLQITHKNMLISSKIIIMTLISTMYSFFLCISLILTYPVIVKLAFKDTQCINIDIFVISKIFFVKIFQLNIISLSYYALKEIVKENYIVMATILLIMISDLNIQEPKLTSFLLLEKNQIIQNYSYLLFLLKVILINALCILFLKYLRISQTSRWKKYE